MCNIYCFPLPQWLNEGVLLSTYTHIACLVTPVLRSKVSLSHLFVQYTRFSAFLGASSLSNKERCSTLVTSYSLKLLLLLLARLLNADLHSLLSSPIRNLLLWDIFIFLRIFSTFFQQLTCNVLAVKLNFN